MQQEIKPKWLLRQAGELAKAPKGRGRPRTADLRRAVSAAYYAIFHTVVGHAVRHLLTDGGRENQLRLARSFDHGSIAEVCRWLTGAGAPKRSAHIRPVVDHLVATELLADVAAAFLKLQEVRHRADYDHLASFSRTQALSYIRAAKLAVANLRYLSNSDAGQLFSVLVAMQKVLK